MADIVLSLTIPDAVVSRVQDWINNGAPQKITRLNAAGTEMITIERVAGGYTSAQWCTQVLYQFISDQVLSYERKDAIQTAADAVDRIPLPES
jgi:hypothetical protein